MNKDEISTVPRAMRPLYEALVEQTDAVCREHLTDEYALVCRRLAAALCRKRPSPVTTGRLTTWACGIVYTIGAANFLFDRGQTPHMPAGELCALFGLKPSTGGNKAAEIRRMLRIGLMDADWCLPSKLERHPRAWLISVNGLIMDARRAPREVQEEAFHLGLIPFLPELRP